MSISAHLASGNRRDAAGLSLQHVGWSVQGAVGVVTLNRPERKNPLTFDSYAELRDLFRLLAHAAVTRRRKDLRDLQTGGKGVHDGVLAAPGTNHQYFDVTAVVI